MVRRARCLAPAMALLALAVMPAAAEDRNAQSEVQGQYDIGGMINQAVRNISARYNLNQEQNQVTQRMMEEGVTEKEIQNVLQADDTLRFARMVRSTYSWEAIYRTRIAPLLSSGRL